MKKNKAQNLEDAFNDDEFKESASLAFEDEEDEKTNEFSDEKNKKPVLSESEVKAKKARRTKFAVAAFVLLLGVGVMGNWYYENSGFSSGIKPSIASSDTKTLGEAEYVDASQTEKESGYFSQARVDRQKARDEAIEKLQKVIDSPESGNDAKKTASEKLADISSSVTAENKIETLVAAKGADNVLAVVNTDSNRVDVIVDVPELSDALILQIKEIAMQQIGCGFEDVSIIRSNNDNSKKNSPAQTTTAAKTEKNS